MLPGLIRGRLIISVLCAVGISCVGSRTPQDRWEEEVYPRDDGPTSPGPKVPSVERRLPRSTKQVLADDFDRLTNEHLPRMIGKRSKISKSTELTLLWNGTNGTNAAKAPTKPGGLKSPFSGFICSMPNGCNLPVEHPSHKAALLALYRATNGPKWHFPPGYEWKESTKPMDICFKWAGVECDPWGRVVKLSLRDYGLRGTIPPEFSDLSSLSLLDLGTNMISGSVPTIGANMTYLYLNQNQFSGTLSPEFAKPGMRHLELSQNKLGGAIPGEFAQMKQLSFFDISANKFNSLPNLGSTLKGLVGPDSKCDLSQNYFACPIPSELKYPAPCGGICGDYVDWV